MHKLILVCGPIGSGKSTTADLIAKKLDAQLLHADLIRKKLFSVPEYTPEETQVLIQELHSRTKHYLQAGQHVVIDALFSQPTARQPYLHIAQAADADILFFVLHTPTEHIEKRLAARSADPYGSDATYDQYSSHIHQRQPPTGTNVFVIDNSGTLDDLAQTVTNLTATSTLPITSQAHVFKIDTATSLSDALAEAGQKGYKTGVCAKITNDSGEILLLCRGAADYFSGIREMPGGGVDPHETLEEAVLREVTEETGLQHLHINQYLGYFDFPNPETGATKRKFCFAVSGDGAILLEDHDAYRFFAPNRLPVDQMYASHRKFLAACSYPGSPHSTIH